MVDNVQVAKRIQDKRKAQCLTQEQLGIALGVSSQAVSKWENGESLPDISLLPSLCKALGISADALLGVDNSVGIESIAQDLGTRIGQLKGDKNNAVMTILKHVLFGEYLQSVGQWADGINLALVKGQDDRVDITVWAQDGLVCKVSGEMVSGETPMEAIDRLRLLAEPLHWNIVEELLSGPKQEDELVQTEDPKDVRYALLKLMAAGVIFQAREGYQLDRNRGLPCVSIIKALCTAFNRPTSIGTYSNMPY